ncbi:MAG: tetratricopeptide repeat protein, partial [Dehalococcoidia bacterium]|nr:tetratricopeptide repeat protein [Dehalococcoidia bacterium]
YRYYLEGLDYNSKYYWAEAERSFRKALEFDSTFAMAYLRVSMEWPDDWEEMLAKAVEYSDNVTHKEKCYIKVQQAYTSDTAQYVKELKKLVERYPDEKDAFLMLGVYYRGWGEFEQAVRHFNRAVEIDPLYKLPYNMLAYAYNELGDFDKSILAIDKYISLAPDEANPYDTRGDLYAWNGKIDQAIESYQKALEIKPDFYASLAKLGNMYLFKREYAKAESCYQIIASHSDKWYRSWGRQLLACIPAYQGKFETALKVLDDGIAADRMEQTEEKATSKHLNKAYIFAGKKNLSSALREVEMAMEIQDRFYPEHVLKPFPIYARLLAEDGDFEKAEEAASALRKNIEEKDQAQMDDYWQLLGNIELAKGDAKTAVTHLEKAAKEIKWWSFSDRFFLGRAYLESGRLGESVAQLEKALRSYDAQRVNSPIWSVKAHYVLGLAYEKSGWYKKAIEQYEEFLEIWKDADPGIPEIDDAKSRLAELKAGI